MIDAVMIKMTFVLTRSCVISGRRFTMMTCVHEIMRGQDGIIWISQNQNRTSTIILQCEHKGHVETNTKNMVTFFVTRPKMWPWSQNIFSFLTVWTWCLLASWVFCTIVVPSSHDRISPQRPEIDQILTVWKMSRKIFFWNSWNCSLDCVDGWRQLCSSILSIWGVLGNKKYVVYPLQTSKVSE